ncbi:unnamed protein product [Bursaphelenchus xylophilus]|uniref:(pine wood nematode) hypothetical protein n=1 Tax=Bursaphelenchus xylophilus TaxID=6326 RepID=A0A1I7SVH4_BURXY|nr:unnamed protein product [Bursaphelenchus xylophilus]CAG9101460.1 unnamed protein product [Bursaphelenchus xylophilus]
MSTSAASSQHHSLTPGPCLIEPIVVQNLGQKSTLIKCPNCKKNVQTRVVYKIGRVTWWLCCVLAFFTLCLLCCFVFFFKSCKVFAAGPRIFSNQSFFFEMMRTTTVHHAAFSLESTRDENHGEYNPSR